MKKYQIQNSIGSGNFSNVFKGLLLPERTPCAIKIVKNYNNIAKRQAQILKKFKHPNIISIINFEQQANQSRLILQYMGINALQLYETPQVHGLQEYQVKSILFQVALGLSCVHSLNIIHRDIKPQNILIDKKSLVVKLIDFGLAIQENESTTDYIATRWYRAPQNLLQTKQYTCAIDIFSLACVIYQLYTGHPLFPGANNLEQISKIFEVLGAPTLSRWAKGYEKMKQLGIIAQEQRSKILREEMYLSDPKLVDLLEKMLQLNPKNRITSTQLLKSQYFKDIKNLVPSSVYKRYQQDILLKQKQEKKPLAFKGFQLVKGIKNPNNSSVPKCSKINFNHVSGKVKLNDILNTQNVLVKIPEQPRMLRQLKSTSVDTYPKINTQLPNTQKQGNQNKFHPSQSLANQNCHGLRKISSPTSSSNVNLNLNLNLNLNFQMHPGQHLQKISSPALFFNFKQQQATRITNHIGQEDNKRTKMSKTQQNNKQMGKLINNQDNNKKSFPLPKFYIPTALQSRNQYQNKNSLQIQNLNKSNSYKNIQTNLNLNESYKNNNYPIIQNVPFVSQHTRHNTMSSNNTHNTNFSSIPIRLSPQISKNIGLQEKKNSFHYRQEEKKSTLISSAKPLQNSDKSFQLTINHNNSQNYRNQKSKGGVDNSGKQQNKPQIKLMKQPTMINNQTRISFPRQNFVPPHLQIHQNDQTIKKPQFLNKSPVNQSYKPYLTSPSPRAYDKTSPDNTHYNFLRNNRLSAVNAPTPFYSPPQRRF